MNLRELLEDLTLKFSARWYPMFFVVPEGDYWRIRREIIQLCKDRGREFVEDRDFPYYPVLGVKITYEDSLRSVCNG